LTRTRTSRGLRRSGGVGLLGGSVPNPCSVSSTAKRRNTTTATHNLSGLGAALPCSTAKPSEVVESSGRRGPYTYRWIEVQYGRGGLKNLVDVTTERVVEPLVRQTYNSCASYALGSVTTTWSNSRPFISSGRAMIRDSG